ncbi:MAG TPA: hypothetical protein DEF18_17975 [Muricauda sp.]|nr:hypothetical protein [Ignavibacteriota bacterium]MBC74363.1 hypothetical protein [Allomuricauda sp.]HBU79989.1 hypothetical protein [Allomuricauda sp.]
MLGFRLGFVDLVQWDTPWFAKFRLVIKQITKVDMKLFFMSVHHFFFVMFTRSTFIALLQSNITGHWNGNGL